MSKRTRTLGLHEWTYEDQLLCFYHTKFGDRGFTGLYIRNISDLCRFMGVTPGSFRMQTQNFIALMGETHGALSDYSNLQKKVFNDWNGRSQTEMKNQVRIIIDHDGHERAKILAAMGKDVSKFRKV